MVALGTLHDWALEPGALVSWSPSPAACEKARQAPVSPVPASYQQTQHLRGFARHRANGLDMARMCIAAWDIAGTCDLPAMTQAITAHLRRHDTYHSWFEYRGDGDVVRRTIPDPADIDVVATRHGNITQADLCAHILAIPDVQRWECFGFGIIQRADDFTFFISVDHLLTDGMSAGVIFAEIHMGYAALVSGAGPLALPEPGSYDEYCTRQRAHTASLTAESPQVRKWISFAECNGASMPDFPLPLGDPSVPSVGAMISVPLMDAEQTAQFESNCEAAGARFSGGVFACAALADHELTGAEMYYGITPYDTRSTPQDYLTAGWFASFIPVAIPATGVPFGDIALAAQECFDDAKDLSAVPFDRVLELAPQELKRPERDIPMLSYIDVRAIPFSSEFDKINFGIYGDSRLSDQVCTWVNRFETQTLLTVSFPENPIARESITRYINAIQRVYARACEPPVTVAAAYTPVEAN